MWGYIIRRIFYAIPILVCINILTFILFFVINSPDHVAHSVMGSKHVKSSDIYRWKREHNYHLPLLFNSRDEIISISARELPEQKIKEELKRFTIHHFQIKNEWDDIRKINIIKKMAEGISGNHIIVGDPFELNPETWKMITDTLLKRAVPFLIPEMKNSEGLQKYLQPSISSVSLSSLGKVVEDQQTKGFEKFRQTLFFKKSVQLFWFNFGKSDRNEQDIGREIYQRMWPSLFISVPAFFMGISIFIFFSMILAFCRGSYVDKSFLVICIVGMSIVSLFYILGAQLIGNELKVFPVSGYQPGFDAIRFVFFPVIISILIDFGSNTRFYRTIFLEEMNRDYIRTARAKGLSEGVVLFKHALKNSMIPILTGVVVVIPSLFTGSLILERFFAIPGLGAYTIEGIEGQDFRVVGSMVYLGSFMYIIALIITDIAYTLVDPRVKLQ